MTATPEATPEAPREAIALPAPGDTVLLTVAVLAISTAGPIIAAAAAPALAVAFWRTAFAGTAVLPGALVRRRAELVGLDRAQWGWALAAGALLAAHFATWVPSVTLTTVASSTALVCTQPVWAALLARAQGHRVSRPVWTGIALSVVGAALLAGGDLTLSGRAFLGDLLAVLGGVFAAAYFTVGARLRGRISTTTYTTVCYPVSAVLLLVCCLLAGDRLVGYPASTWALLVALAVGPQLLGHSLLNVSLRSASPTLVSLVTLFEVPGSAVIAAVWLGQVPPAVALPGLVLLVAGVAVVVRAGRPVVAG